MNHVGTIRLETTRLILRRVTAEDAQAMFYHLTSDDEVTKYLTFSPHETVERTLEYIRYCSFRYQDPSFYTWGMELKETHELIGCIIAEDVFNETQSVELGWYIGKKYWGNGYTPEAAKAILDFLFDMVGANCVFAGHDVNNPNSGCVMQKIGMKFEGILRQSIRNNQGIVDWARYSIIRADRISCE